MKLLDLTLPTPAQNLACDETLLDWCEGGGGEEVLRFWESPAYFVVLGYTKPWEREADTSACEQADVPILRRSTGGGTVLQGPGCLNYSLLLRIGDNEGLKGITETNRTVMERHRAALESLLAESITVRGVTDLVWRGRKFSGNAQRRRQKCLLFHGTFLLDFDLPLIEKYLRQPEQQPAYRENRPHRDFIGNLGLSAAKVKSALQSTWGAAVRLETMPYDEIADLAREKYADPVWTRKF